MRPISNTSPFPSRAPLPKGEQAHRDKEREAGNAQRPRALETRFERHPRHPTSQVSQRTLCSCPGLPGAELFPI